MDKFEQELHDIVCGCPNRGGCERYEYREETRPKLLALMRQREREAFKTYKQAFFDGIKGNFTCATDLTMVSKVLAELDQKFKLGLYEEGKLA